MDRAAGSHLDDIHGGDQLDAATVSGCPRCCAGFFGQSNIPKNDRAFVASTSRDRDRATSQ
jgi:hypothetical protein